MKRALRPAPAVALAAAAAALAAAAQAVVVEPNRITLSRVELPSGRLAAALGGGRLVHLSDLHLKGWGTRETRLLQALREADPSLIVMTGDYADTSEGIATLGRLFSDVRPDLGIVAVPGNNDYYRGRQEAIFSALRGAGVTLLRNDAVVVEASGGRIAVAGVDDPFFGRDDAGAALGRVPPGAPVVLLAHSPAVLEERGEAMLFNAGDASGPWGRGWFWQDGSHFRDPLPAIAFQQDGVHVIRMQRREDGVGVGGVRLVPAASGLTRTAGRRPGEAPPHATGEIDVDLCSADEGDVRGSWRLSRGEEGACALFDEPDRGRLASFPEVEPADRADVRFEAPAGVLYHVWVRLFSPTSTGRSDSVYLQFGDSVDGAGVPRFRIGSRVPPAAGPGVDLVLAGHTHGGQVRLPWIGAVERTLIPGPFVMGRYHVDGTMVYVSRGIGTSYLPVRLGCPPEVVVVSPPRAERGEVEGA